jgi:xanthine dehydrogenase iron-sulfur cluster and FAD-binding subunit A
MTAHHDRSSGMREGHSHQGTGDGGHPFPNSRILAHPFDYVRPASLEDAVTALKDSPSAVLLAGGTNLLVDIKLERAAPSALVDISGLDALSQVEHEEGEAHIGSLASIRCLATDTNLWRKHTCLPESAAAFGSTQVMMRGTLGGNIANGSPASDTVPALVVLGADVDILGPTGRRTVLVADLLQGPGRVALAPGDIITTVRIPSPPANTGSSFLKLSRVRADLAKVSVAVRLVRSGDRIMNARIALGSVGPTVLRAKRASEFLSGRIWRHETVLEAARIAASEIRAIDDVRSTAEYRRRAAAALVFDAISVAWNRTDEAPPPLRGHALPRPPEQRPLRISSTEKIRIALTVNGHAVTLDVSPNELLLNVLRERLELTGTKYGCGIGECGACTIWLNGMPVLGCLVLAVSADGGEVRTIEGLAAPDGTLDPLQEAFIDENAFQCGYCTPGMLMMTKKLLEENPQPTEDEVRDYLKGNHCRCTGYASITRAVLRASGRAHDDGVS